VNGRFILGCLMATYLDAILAEHRRAAEADPRSVDDLFERAAAASGNDPVRDFAAALAGPGLSVIAEVKRRSPSKGALVPDLDPAQLARSYASGGAACLSVLTDHAYFGGFPADLAAARRAVPVLRKDFTVGASDVADARLMGADAVLLIAAALSDPELEELSGRVAALGLTALHEVHDEAEVERVLAVGAAVVGVNQRDLFSFQVDPDRAVRVGRALPAGIIRVAESGIGGAEDAKRLADAGFDAVLVGEFLVRAADPAAAVAALRAAAPVGA
jgi:indole-3-glycerol phosphate synthase